MTITPSVYPEWNVDAARDVISMIAREPGPVLRCLQAIQERFGYVPAEAVSLVAETCNVSRADVHGVLTFYADLRSTPPPAIPVRLCAAEACQAVGGRALRDQWNARCDASPELAASTGVDEPIFCLGNCALGPAAMVGGELVGFADVDSIEQRVRHAMGASS